ncbi:peptidylprolyl isomerase [Anaerococcus sp. AGMB00486]|uniref:Foldase protein PrsA n=2 Tax=Anaerococcus TaxID=165779 RepID=A0ABX2N7B7_9FIRM|nr:MULTISPECIES: peptidylprolyl isomerase [Anaerococcus]MDY3005801.1 peptidylprolyl isomerase [Anaerococcus porci]MSS76939.1 peptidylprolyl isomerase [Anaerococcus porci]NVF10576.1 peptidylprolyl isomerase [Anaerococcus faecalis]
MNKKILALVLATGFVLGACSNNNTNNNASSNKKETTATESSNQEKDKTNKDVKLEDDAVAMVANEKIPKDAYKDEMSFYSAMLASQQQLKSSIVNMMIQDKLISNDMKKNNVKVDDKEVNEKFLKYIQQFGGEEKFDKMLDDYNMSSDKFKETIKKDQIYQKHRAWFEENNPVSDDEIKKYFDENKDNLIQVKASHILVEDEATAKELKEKLDKGEDFAKLAKEYSKDTANAAKGGDLGYFNKSQMAKEFSDKAFSMNKGEISDPVKTSYGYHIIKVEDKKDSAEDLKEDISKALNDKKYSEYLTKLFNDAKVVTEDGPQTKNSETDIKQKNNDSSNKENKENSNSNN